MSDEIYHTLYHTPSNGTITDYELQITTTFEDAIYEAVLPPVKVNPQNEGDDFKVTLKIKPGSDSHIVHSFSIGMFPDTIENWMLDIEYVDENGKGRKRRKRVRQATVESEPKPVKNGVLG